MVRARSQLARQVAVLGLVFCAVALALAVPLRDYLTQRAELAATLGQEQQLRVQYASLEQEKAALADPAYIESEARRRLQYVKPGDTVYVVNAPALPTPTPTTPVTAATTAPWYEHLWATLSDPPGVEPGAPAPGGKAPR